MQAPLRASVQPLDAPTPAPFLPAPCSTWEGRYTFRIVRGAISVKCHWCRAVHVYSREEIERAWAALETETDMVE